MDATYIKDEILSSRLLSDIKCILNSRSKTTSIILCDDVNGDGTLYVGFVRHTVYKNDGSIERFYDTTLDLDSDYVVLGTTSVCN